MKYLRRLRIALYPANLGFSIPRFGRLAFCSMCMELL
jgi:hypothetical protein